MYVKIFFEYIQIELEIKASGVFLTVNMKVFQGLHPQNSHQGPALDPLEGGGEGLTALSPDPPTEIATRFARTIFASRIFSAAPKKILYYPLLVTYVNPLVSTKHVPVWKLFPVRTPGLKASSIW